MIALWKVLLLLAGDDQECLAGQSESAMMVGGYQVVCLEKVTIIAFAACTSEQMITFAAQCVCECVEFN